MGYIEIIRPDGSGFSTKRDSEGEFATFNRCDKCDELVDTKGGKYIESNGEFIMWVCVECR